MGRYGSWRTLLMKEASSQGCPLSPLFASFVVARLLQPIDTLLRDRATARLTSGDPGDDGFFGGISHLLGYVDDISSCVYLPDLPFLRNTIKNIGAIPRMLCQPIENTHPHILQRHIHSPPHSQHQHQPHLSKTHLRHDCGILHSTPPYRQVSPSTPS